MGRHTRLASYQIEVIDFQKRNDGEYSPPRTLIKRNTTKDRARRWASSFGSVLTCRKIGMSADNKVSMSPYLNSIEHILDQEAVEIGIDKEEFTLNESLELRKNGKKHLTSGNGM